LTRRFVVWAAPLGAEISGWRKLIVAKFIEFRRALVLVALLSSVGGTAFAQSVSSGVIEGTVKDASGGVLPGATITASSPQLQVGQVNKVSGADGNYRF